jgi:hypothetical protein
LLSRTGLSHFQRAPPRAPSGRFPCPTRSTNRCWDSLVVTSMSLSSSLKPSSILPPYQHWKIEYRKIIGIYRNFDGKLLHSYSTSVSEVFLELIALLRQFQRCFGS